MRHTHFTSGGVAERRLIYAMNAPDGMGQSESHNQPEKFDPKSMDALLPDAENLAADPAAENNLEVAAVANTNAELEAPRTTLANARAVLEGMQADSTEQAEDPAAASVDTGASVELPDDSPIPVSPDELPDELVPPPEVPEDPETARLTGEIDESIQALQRAKTPGEALEAIGKLFAAITEMIRRIFGKDTVKDADGGANPETDLGDASQESAAKQAPEEDERVRGADTPEAKQEALAAVGTESKETLESNNAAIKDIDTEIGALEGQKTTLDGQTAELQSQIDSAEDTEGPAKRRILQTRLEGLKKQAASLQETIDAHTTHRNELVAENEALQQKIEAAEQAKDRIGSALDAMHKIEKVLQEIFGIEAKIELDEGKAIFVVTQLGESTPEWFKQFLIRHDQDQNPDNGYQIDLDRADWLSKMPESNPEAEGPAESTAKGGIDTTEAAESLNPVAEAERIITSIRNTIEYGNLPSEQDLRGLHDALRAVQDRSDTDENAEALRAILAHDLTIFTGSAGDRYQLLRGGGDRYTLVRLDAENVGTSVVSDKPDTPSDAAAQAAEEEPATEEPVVEEPVVEAPVAEPEAPAEASAAEDAETSELLPEDLRKRQEWAEAILETAKEKGYPVVAVDAQKDGKIAITFDTTDAEYVQKLDRAAEYARARGIYSERDSATLTVDIARESDNKGYFGKDFDQQAMDAFESKLDDGFAS